MPFSVRSYPAVSFLSEKTPASLGFFYIFVRQMKQDFLFQDPTELSLVELSKHIVALDETIIRLSKLISFAKEEKKITLSAYKTNKDSGFYQHDSVFVGLPLEFFGEPRLEDFLERLKAQQSHCYYLITQKYESKNLPV